MKHGKAPARRGFFELLWPPALLIALATIALALEALTW